jgi:hypothetical protein
MKKVKSANRRSEAKSNGAPKNVDEYLAGVPEPARSTLNKIRAAIHVQSQRITPIVSVAVDVYV